MAKTRQIRRQTAEAVCKPLADPLPHHAAVGIAVEQQYRRSVPPCDHVDSSVANPNLACRFLDGLAERHRRLRARGSSTRPIIRDNRKYERNAAVRMPIGEPNSSIRCARPDWQSL